MALGGDLKNINLGDIFQTLSMNQQVGTLVVHRGVKEKRVHFNGRGVSLSSGRTIPGFRIGNYLLGSGRITHEDLHAALEDQRGSGELLGRILVRLGYCTDEDVDEVIRYHAAEELYEIFTWKEGEFEFIEGTSADSDAQASPYARIEFDAGSIVMEAARRIDEWARFEEVLPCRDDFLVRTGLEGSAISTETWGPDAAAIYALVDGTRTARDILEEYHLAAFDTGMTLRDLILNQLVRIATFEELVKSARELQATRDTEKAARCLERAHAAMPRDVDTLQLLADSYEKLDEKRAAAGCLTQIGSIHIADGDPASAADALEKAEKYDPGSEEAPILLIRAYQLQGEGGRVAEKARSAASILCEKQRFGPAIEFCRAGLEGAPEHVGLRIVLANAFLGNGQQEEALAELEAVAASLEEARSYRKLEEIYKKILQLDSSRREYLRRLQALKEGKARRRKRLFRIATFTAAGAVLLSASLFFFAGKSGAEEVLARARRLAAAGDLTTAKKLAQELARKERDSDLGFQARNLVFELEKKGRTPAVDSAEGARKLEDRLEEFYRPASDLFRDGRYEEGEEHLLDLGRFLNDAKGQEMRREVGTAAWNRVRAEYSKMVSRLLGSYADTLDAFISTATNELAPLQEAKLTTAEAKRVKEVTTAAKSLLARLDPAPRGRIIEKAAAIEIAISEGRAGAGKETAANRMKAAAETLDGLYERTSVLYHTAHALFLDDDLRSAFRSTIAEINEKKNAGELTAAERASSEFLMRCADLRDQKPGKYYETVVADLLGPDGLDLDGKMKKELEGLTKVRAGLDAAEKLVEEGSYEKANALFAGLIKDHIRVNFQDLVHFCLFLEVQPPGAQVTVTRKGDAPRVVGTAGPKGLLVRYPPYGETVVTVTEATFEASVFHIKDYTAAPPGRSVVRMKKKPAWQWTGAGPLQATPLPYKNLLLVTSRDGHLRVFDEQTGNLGYDLDTRALSGFSSPPLLEGECAWLSSLDGALVAVDMTTHDIRVATKTENRLRTRPVLLGDVLVVADEQGTVYGIRGEEILWRVALTGRVQAEPAPVEDGVVVGTTEGHVAFITPDGKVRWDRQPGGRIYASPVAGPDGRIYVGTDAGEVYCVSAADGSRLWKSALGSPVRGRILLEGDHLYLGTTGGSICALEAADGKVVARCDYPDGISFESGLAPGDHGFYAVDTAGELHALDKELSPTWIFPLGSPSLAPPLVQKGRVYVVTEAGSLFCFRE